MTSTGRGDHAAAMTTSPRSVLRPHLWILGVCWLLPAALVGLGWLLLRKELPPGQCEGIGFGCTLAPADTAGTIGCGTSPTSGTLSPWSPPS